MVQANHNKSTTTTAVRKYATAADGKTMIEIIGEWGYGPNGEVYQWKLMALPPGWYPVASATMPQPFAHSVKGTKKKK